MSDYVLDLLDYISQGDNTTAMEILDYELKSRALERIDEIKPEVAQNYFSPILDTDEED